MTVKLDPLVSEFETNEQAASYDAWFRVKVLEAMNSSKPAIPHDEAMARVRAKVAEKKAARAGPAVA